MPISSPETHLQQQAPPQRVVPGAFIFDRSEYAQHGQKCFLRIRELRFEKVAPCGAPTEAGRLLQRFFSSGFGQSIAPLSLMDHVAGWCVWFLADDTTNASDFLNLLQSLQESRRAAFHHILFLRVAKPDGAHLWASKLAAVDCVLFLLCPQVTLERSDVDLARAAVAYAYSSWRRYFKSGEANLVTALGLPASSGTFTLGMGASELDVEYHAGRMAQKILDRLKDQLLSRTQNVGPPVLKTLSDCLAFLLPDWYLAATDQSTRQSVQVTMGDDTVALHYLEPQRKSARSTLPRHGYFQHQLAHLKDKFWFLTFIALPNARRFVERRAKGFWAEVWQPVADCLRLSDKPDSLIHVLSQGCRYCADHATTMLRTSVQGESPSGSFQQDFKDAHARISAIPNLVGAGLRLLLIGIGLAGLVLSPFWWGGVRNPLADNLLRYVALGAGMMLVVCATGVLGHYAYACWVADHHLELAENNAERRHLRQVAAAAIERIRTAGVELDKTMSHLRQKLESVSEAIRNTSLSTTRPVPSPSGGWLTPECIDEVMQPHLTQLAEQTYLRVASELNVGNDSSGLVSLEPSLWQKLLSDQALAVARDGLERLTFDQCVAAMRATADKKACLISNLVSEALKPAWPDIAASPSVTLCYADPDHWRDHRGQHDTIQFCKLDLKDMLVVSVFPCRSFAEPWSS